MKAIIKKLKGMKGENDLKDAVIDYILDYYTTEDEIKGFFEDLQEHGCVSGMVGCLIYYHDTVAFYDKYEDEIEDLIYDTQEEMGYKNRFEFLASLNGADNVGDMMQEKNLLSWFAFEETAHKIYVALFEEE